MTSDGFERDLQIFAAWLANAMASRAGGPRSADGIRHRDRTARARHFGIERVDGFHEDIRRDAAFLSTKIKPLAGLSMMPRSSST